MPGRKNYLEDFYDWMISTGKKPKKRDKPSLPMAPSGCKVKYKMVRRMLVDIGYVKSVNNGGRGNNYLVWPEKGCKRIYNLRPENFINWINNEFRILKNRQDKSRKAAYVFAAWKFGEYMHWKMKDRHGTPLWTAEQLAKLKHDIYPPQIKKFEISILPLEITDEYIEFIKTRDLTDYTMMYLCRWLGGMRYQEVINAPLDLNGPTLKINFKTGEITIWGKGDGGLQKERYPSLLPDVKEVILEYLEYRKKVIPATPEDGNFLFLSPHKKKYSENPTGFNRRLRSYAREWGKLSEKEMSLVTTHKIGRHSFGTYWAPRISMKLLKEEMGIEDYNVLERYMNISKKERAEILREAKDSDNGNGYDIPQQQENDKLSTLKELISGLSKEEKLQLLAEVIG